MSDEKIQELTNESFNKDVLEKKGFVLVDFWAPWCGPCRMMSPILDELSTEINKVEFKKINIDKNQDLANSYRILSIPCFILFKNGKAIASRTGACSKEDLKDWILNNSK